MIAIDTKTGRTIRLWGVKPNATLFWFKPLNGYLLPILHCSNWYRVRLLNWQVLA